MGLSKSGANKKTNYNILYTSTINNHVFNKYAMSVYNISTLLDF